MKCSSKILIGLAAVAAGALALTACNNRMPSARSYPANPPDYTTIINFENSDLVNPTLLGATPGGNSKMLWGEGGLDPTGSPGLPHALLIVPVPPSMADGTLMACHVVDTFTDKGDATYPSAQLRVKPAGLGYFDVSPFSGIKFMINIQAGDNCPKRRFSIAVAQTLPIGDPDGGATCDNSNNGCNNNFGVSLDNTLGAWATKSYQFTDLTRESFGSPTSPASFSGVHLAQVIRLNFESGRNNSPGVAQIDYWVDQIEFY